MKVGNKSITNVNSRAKLRIIPVDNLYLPGDAIEAKFNYLESRKDRNITYRHPYVLAFYPYFCSLKIKTLKIYSLIKKETLFTVPFYPFYLSTFHRIEERTLLFVKSKK